MNNKQIAFITCVNDDEEYAECRYYLERLYVPDGYSTDIISIQEAPSMAAGYNAGMKSSNAKYKVYLHQDVFIKNRNFIADLLAVFIGNDQIGMLGVVGNRLLWEDVTAMMLWDTGNVADSCRAYSFRFPKKEDGFMEVRMIDGLLLATQYDLWWREDLFDGWHFYDLAQCMEFKKAGYKVAIPWQERAWCYHDNSCPQIVKYFDCYEQFAREYGESKDFPVENREMDWAFYEENRKCFQLQEDLKKIVEDMFWTGDREKLRNFFENPDMQELRCLYDYKMIVQVDCQEEKNQSPLRFWESELQLSQLLSRLRVLKHVLKRIEFGADTEGEEKSWIIANYSYYAVSAVYNHYLKQ